MRTLRTSRFDKALATLAAAVVLASASLVSGCDDDESGDPNTGSPAASNVTPVATIFPASEGGEEQLFFTLACDADTITITTTLRIVRAALPCDRLPPADVIERFQLEPTEIEVRPGPPGKILLRAEAGGSLEFTVEDVRVEEP